MTAARPIPLTGLAQPVVSAGAHWRSVDFISDLHLQAGQPATYQAWQHYMARTPADALFILGDLFEVWVGDDAGCALPGQPLPFEAQCQQVLAGAAQRLDLFFMHGNRDFLLGERFAQGAGLTLLSDPTTLVFDAQRWLLSHGDALCLGDTAYQQFRATVRTPVWRTDFLAKPLAERQRIARQLRLQSESLKAGGAPWVDVDPDMACAWLAAAGASTLIHGHTHRPGDEPLTPGADPLRQRRVLSDWDASAQPPRLQVLRLRIGQPPQRIALPTSSFQIKA